LAIWEEVIRGAILTKCGVCGYMVHIITYAIFGDCRLSGVGVMRGLNLPSPIDLRCRPYNTGHIRCNRVIDGVCILRYVKFSVGAKCRLAWWYVCCLAILYSLSSVQRVVTLFYNKIHFLLFFTFSLYYSTYSV